jgi:hypothetical protein
MVNARIREVWKSIEMLGGGELKRPRPRLGCSTIEEKKNIV